MELSASLNVCSRNPKRKLAGSESKDQNIYNSAGAFWVGPLATVESVGQKVTFVAEDGSKATIVQPKNAHYTLTVGEHVLYVVDQGHVWVQPVDYPLPPDFTASQTSTHKPRD